MRDRWVQQGLTPREEMQTDCCYALQDKAWVRDPDGNEWEVFVVLQDNLPEKTLPGPTEGCCASVAGGAQGACESATRVSPPQ